GIDLEHDRADTAAGRLLERPLLALWGAHGTVGRLYDTAATWREVANGPVQGEALPCGPLLQEERPEEVADRLAAFLAGGPRTGAPRRLPAGGARPGPVRRGLACGHGTLPGRAPVAAVRRGGLAPDHRLAAARRA